MNMSNIKKAVILTLLISVINFAVSFAILQILGKTKFSGYFAGTLLNFIFSLLWILGARKGMKSNSLLLLVITVGGFPVRLAILALFAFGGLYLLNMDKVFFAISFLVGTMLSLIIEIWFFNTLRFPSSKKM
jgi:hypothetical protein